jgi:hypothetical protein
MDLLKRLTAAFNRPKPSQDSGYWVYIRCERCGEPIQARIDLLNDLSVEYGKQDSDDRYFVRKQVIGSGLCFQPIEIELAFDHQRRLIDRSINGGEFISQEEYQAAIEGADEGSDK